MAMAMATTLTVGALFSIPPYPSSSSSSSSHFPFPFSHKSQLLSLLSKPTFSSPSLAPNSLPSLPHHKWTAATPVAALESKPREGDDAFSVVKGIFKRMPQYPIIEGSLLRCLHRTPPSKTHVWENGMEAIRKVFKFAIEKYSMDLRFLDNHGSKKSLECITCDHHLIDDAPESIGSVNRTYKFVDTSYIYSGLRVMLIAGLLIFQGSEQAIADTEFTGGIQPLGYLGDLGDISTGFASAFLLIFFSELGDKTFFIADEWRWFYSFFVIFGSSRIKALLAARNSGAVVFIGTFGALAAMSIVSVVLGRTFHYVDGILPFRLGETDLPIDDLAAVCLLVYFGVTTLFEASSSDNLEINEERKEAELAVSELSANGAGIMAAASTVISTFLLVFVAEWGDKSFFSTIALAAASSPLGVIGGAFAGHALATLLAVIGGSLLGTYFSEKVIAYIGGVLFLVFAVVTLIETVS